MADDAPSADETPITFNVKSSADAKYVITLPLTTSVLDLKRKLSGQEYADIPEDRQRLIYSGRVLKDADTLSTYKIKEGNTVHLVKGAASNQRQNPAATTGSSTTNGPSQGAAGVPSNLAAGTGRDPLAGLTGARYAGYAQMPNANLFGPDGGMGPPPDPEQVASMLEQPEVAAQMNAALSNPAVIEQMIQSNPMFRGPMAQQARQALNDPNFRRMITDPEMMRNMSNMRRTMPGLFGGLGGQAGGGNQAFPMPGNAEGGENGGDSARDQGAQPDQTGTNQQQPPNPLNPFGGGTGAGAAGNPFAALFGGIVPPSGAAGTEAGGSEAGANATQPQQGQPTNPYEMATRMLTQNPQMMQQMMGAMGGMEAPTDPNDPSANNAQQANPFAALQALGGMGGFGGMGGSSPQPPDNRPPEDRYAEQLRQLNDMGFYEFERNVEALRRTGGSVQGAVEYLLTH